MHADNGRHQPLCLLSASMDKTMIIWRPHAESGIWMENVTGRILFLCHLCYCVMLYCYIFCDVIINFN